ncbi:hypothetical protein [Haloflavibacter putidus]|uniref:Lipoprotein n=1 Tax=Haloflavibacter putidus TaxID=2576776 RepID=A0A507ZSA4_9FLAO|nr:hypothetical protein [Haloflavibacter putidus]TQD40510.1 hypothetical protein FKR84_00600 [Haloflavibacter putidus]
MMKKTNQILLFFILSLSLIACSSNDDSTPTPTPEPSSDNYLKIGENTYDLKFGRLEYFEEYNGVHSFDLELLNEGISSENGEPTTENLHGIIFEINTSTPADINTGTYTASTDYIDYSFNGATTVENYNIDTEEGHYRGINSGELEVLQNGNVYEFSFEGSTTNDIPVSLYYKGGLICPDLEKTSNSSIKFHKK